MSPPAFLTPLPLSAHQPTTTALTQPTKSQYRSAKHAKHRATTHQPALSLARNRIDPRDEAFITCSSCGSDTPISAKAITTKGTMPVRCSGCGNRFIARAEDALTITGQCLASVPAMEEEEDPKTGIVNLYISGLGPKTDSATLKAALEEFGEVTKANIIYDRVTGRSRGFGFVSIVGWSAASAAIDVLSGDTTRLGRRLKVREAIDR